MRLLKKAVTIICIGVLSICVSSINLFAEEIENQDYLDEISIDDEFQMIEY